MQGVRIRGLQLSNTTSLPYLATSDDAGVTYPAGNHDAEIRWVYKAPTFGVAVASTLAGLQRNTTTDRYDNAVDVAEIVLGSNGSTGAQLNDLTVRASGYTDKGEVGGINWSTPAGATRVYKPVFMEETADYVVEPGSYIALYCAGCVKYLNGHTGDAIQGPMFLEYSWDVLLDAMIPIP